MPCELTLNYTLCKVINGIFCISLFYKPVSSPAPSNLNKLQIMPLGILCSITWNNFIHSLRALQLLGLGTLLRSRNLFYADGRTPWTGISASQGRYTQDNTNMQ
jgi:hypothetical protein